MAIAIMTSGGDCAGMNPAIAHFVNYCLNKDLKTYLIYNGLEGLIDAKIKKASYSLISGIMHLGGTILRSSRSKRFFKFKHRKSAYENLKKHNIDKVVVLGGDGSFRALNQFYKDFGIRFVGIPSTIDNDIYGTEYCLGVDTALNIIRSSIDAMIDTSSSFNRACVIETMGRDCGYLALVSAITCGADVCIINEAQFNLKSLSKKLKKRLKKDKSYIVCINSEGSKMTKKLVKWLNNDVKIETRATILGHIQRGGNPTVTDRLMAAEFIKYAVDKLLSNNQDEGLIVVSKNSNFEFVTIEHVNSQKYQLDSNLITLAKNMME